MPTGPALLPGKYSLSRKTLFQTWQRLPTQQQILHPGLPKSHCATPYAILGHDKPFSAALQCVSVLCARCANCHRKDAKTATSAKTRNRFDALRSHNSNICHMLLQPWCCCCAAALVLTNQVLCIAHCGCQNCMLHLSTTQRCNAQCKCKSNWVQIVLSVRSDPVYAFSK